jgi:hypothetical protein
MSQAAFEIFWVDGTADGVWLADKAGWVGVVVVCPRTAWTQHKRRAEFDRAGVYILDSSSGEKEEIYIGEADVLRARLDNHYVNEEWIRVVAVTTKDGSLNKAHVKHLESRLLELADLANRATVVNGHQSRSPQLSEVERFKAENFLGEALPLLRLVGVNAFSAISRSYPSPGVHAALTQALILESAGVHASGYVVPDGFLVTEARGLPARPKPSLPAGQVLRRLALIEEGKLQPDGDRLRLVEPTLFSSPSAAASLLHGRPADGIVEWTDGTHTLKELQEKEAAG